MKFQRSLAAAAVAALSISVPTMAQAAPPSGPASATPTPSSPAAMSPAPASTAAPTVTPPASVGTAQPSAPVETAKPAEPSGAAPTQVERATDAQPQDASRAAQPAAATPAATTPTATTPAATTPIATLHAAQGGATGWLGAATSGEAPVAGVNGAVWQRFANGDIYWSQATGAHYVNAAVRTMIADPGVGIVKLGLPKSDSTGGAQYFEKGIAWLRGNAAYAVMGAQLDVYGQLGGDAGLGAPTSNPRLSANGEGAQYFERGIIWIRAQGSFAVWGAALATYGPLGGDGGVMGAPKSNVIWNAPYRGFQYFEKGIMWITERGAFAVYGPILSAYGSVGGDGGPLGAPTSNVHYAGSSGFQYFERGIMYSTPRGTFPVQTGGILEAYGPTGGDGGALGAPIGGQYPVQWGRAQRFVGGTIIINNGVVDVALNSHIDARCTYGRVFCANKSDRKVRWMENGQIVYSMDARYGIESLGWGTEEGEQWISRKVRREVSSIDGSQMPYSMYFNNTGEAVHYSQGFANVGWQGGSHGCINVRDWAGVEWLYDHVVRIGDRVVVHR